MSFFSELGLTNKNTQKDSLQQGSLFKKNKASYKSISKISNISIKEGVNSGDEGASSSSVADINNSVRVFNEQLQLYEVKMNEYQSKQQTYFQLLNQSTGMWEKLDATCSHNDQGGYYKSSTNVDIKDCLKTCDEDDECMGVSYSANPKKCFFMKKKCDGGIAETIGKPDDMQHYSGTISDLEKCSWRGLNNIRVRVGKNGKTIESEQLKEGCSIIPCSAGQIRHIDNHKTWNEAQGQLAHNCYIKDRAPWKDNGNPVWANFNKTTKNKMTEVDNIPQGVYEVPQEARELKSELSTLNSELIELTNQMTEQIAMIVQVDSSLKQHLETQKQEVTEASRNLQDDRLNLERNNERQMNIINGLYNDSELKETTVNYEYMAWILGSITIVGISMYQIKRFS